MHTINRGESKSSKQLRKGVENPAKKRDQEANSGESTKNSTSKKAANFIKIKAIERKLKVKH
jgi:hypothetical protein